MPIRNPSRAPGRFGAERELAGPLDQGRVRECRVPRPPGRAAPASPTGEQRRLRPQTQAQRAPAAPAPLARRAAAAAVAAAAGAAAAAVGPRLLRPARSFRRPARGRPPPGPRVRLASWLQGAGAALLWTPGRRAPARRRPRCGGAAAPPPPRRRRTRESRLRARRPGGRIRRGLASAMRMGRARRHAGGRRAARGSPARGPHPAGPAAPPAGMRSPAAATPPAPPAGRAAGGAAGGRGGVARAVRKPVLWTIWMARGAVCRRPAPPSGPPPARPSGPGAL
jgi:hypothetical protein